ncbi:DUF4192 domain-containing protein [Paenarthrobacter sp. Z7-10]|uniref:DUF4192 family protein n=1 Tax=Paenarthrobacter sp. Z7-10 TaxID=2787635 RepID=UPI0022A9941A|nr:DUF4192 family protein [Paenarthrobacter sp. Z7-10]MCZ2403565.1 DUF4192 domain-containing protein [Paenarthrobacter sp. Z7-10]
MNEKMKVSTGAGIIAFALHTLGFVPTESLVIMGVAGNRMRATLRMDLPRSEAANETISTVATSAILSDVEATASLFIVFTGDTGTDGQPREALVEALMRELVKGGIPARNGWLVGPEGWMSYLDLDAQMHPMSEVTDGITNAELTFRGSSYAATNEATIPDFAGDAIATATRIAAQVTSTETDTFDTAAEPMVTARATWQNTIDSRATAEDNTALIAFLQDAMIRDRLMADIVATSTSVEDFNNAMMGNLTDAPNWRRVDDAEATLLQLLTETPGKYRAPLLTVTGWIQWLKGKGTHASQYFLAALETDGSYQLAQLFDRLTDAGHVAPVAKNQATGYKPE